MVRVRSTMMVGGIWKSLGTRLKDKSVSRLLQLGRRKGMSVDGRCMVSRLLPVCYYPTITPVSLSHAKSGS